MQSSKGDASFLRSSPIPRGLGTSQCENELIGPVDASNCRWRLDAAVSLLNITVVWLFLKTPFRCKTKNRNGRFYEIPKEYPILLADIFRTVVWTLISHSNEKTHFSIFLCRMPMGRYDSESQRRVLLCQTNC